MYCMSTENWSRPVMERDVILRLIEGAILEKLSYAHKHQVLMSLI